MYSKTFKGSHYIQFSSRRCIYVLGKAHYITYICTPPHFVSFLNIAFETVPMFIRLMMTLLSFQNSRKTMEHCFLFPCLSPPGDSSCDVLGTVCQQVVFPALQHFRSSEMQAICVGCFSHLSICSVISLHSGMSNAVHPQEFLKLDVNQ